MALDITPFSLWRTRFPTVWDDEDWDLAPVNSGGVTISEDAQNVYVEAAVPGIDPKDIEVTFDKGVVWIKGETKEEEKGKKYYRKATSAFSYRVAVPGDIDMSKDFEAAHKNGTVKIAFAKSPASQPKKIAVKSS